MERSPGASLTVVPFCRCCKRVSWGSCLGSSGRAEEGCAAQTVVYRGEGGCDTAWQAARYPPWRGTPPPTGGAFRTRVQGRSPGREAGLAGKNAGFRSRHRRLPGRRPGPQLQYGTVELTHPLFAHAELLE